MLCLPRRGLVALALIATSTNAPALRAQTPHRAPLLQTGSRLFALGVPHALGALTRVYDIRWRNDSRAVAFFGFARPATRASETKALARGEAVPAEEEPTLLVYDLDTARLMVIGRFQAAHDNEYFREAHWVGLNLYVATGVPPSENVPAPPSRLYLYDVKAARAALVTEMPAGATLEASQSEAPFLVERFFEGENQRFHVIAEGKVIPLQVGNGVETFGLYGWSVDGSAYYVQGGREEVGAKALEIRYKNGDATTQSVAFNARRDLFAAQPVKEPLFTLRQERDRPAAGLLSLLGHGATPSEKEAPGLPVTHYALALAAGSDDSFSLAPNATALIYVAQETLFLQRLVELQGTAKNEVMTRLKDAR